MILLFSEILNQDFVNQSVQMDNINTQLYAFVLMTVRPTHSFSSTILVCSYAHSDIMQTHQETVLTSVILELLGKILQLNVKMTVPQDLPMKGCA